MYVFSMDGTDNITLVTAHAPEPRQYSCGETPRATLAELQDYSARIMASGLGYRFLVVDLVDIFDQVLIITGDTDQPVDPDQDVWLHQVTSDDYAGDDDDDTFTVPVGGFTWGQVPVLRGERVTDAARNIIRTTAGSVREYLVSLDADREDEATIVEAFAMDATMPDATPVSALYRDLEGTVLA